MVDNTIRPTGSRDAGALYQWQIEALTTWLQCGRRGVIEAVTGSGKTNLAIAAIVDAHRRGLFVLVIVPSRVLINQWHERLTALIPDCTVGRLGDDHRDHPEDCDVLITTRHSAASHRPVPPNGRGGLLVADECHGYGGGKLRRSLLKEYGERLGLTATLERSDDAVEKVLIPFFGGVCYRYGFGEAIRDGVCAQPRVAFVSVALSETDRKDYVAAEAKLVASRSILRSIPNMPLEPFGDFLAAVSHLADNDAGPHGTAANDYLKSFSHRREIVASSTSKYEALGAFADTIRSSDGALIFTETVRAANHAVNRLDPEINIEIITGETPRKARERILDDLRVGALDAVAAPRVLDEGIDVPNANLGIVVTASRTRRQMIQRMGRVLRRKDQGSGARFVIIFARDTLEDPMVNEERDGFLEEIERISENSRVFEESERDRLVDFLDYTGPKKIIDPVQVGPMTGGDKDTPVPVLDSKFVEAVRNGETEAWSALSAEGAEAHFGELLERIDIQVLYAHLSYLPWTNETWLHHDVWSRHPDEAIPEPEYLEVETTEMPTIGKPKPKKHRLSTGQQPVQLAEVPGGWAVRCLGCGAASATAEFKWQALDRTVQCSCTDW
ncbi:MAG: DEAD/DEAH box helicase [Acidimicrobiales bacterium]